MIPKTLMDLVEELKKSRAHTYASENADHYRGFDDGQIRAAETLERLIRAWDEWLSRAIPDGALPVRNHILGVKDKR